jgi:hypothetical protein
MAEVRAVWVNGGNVRWEQWWVQSQGYSRTREPGESDHVGFANYDLQRSGVMKLQPHKDGGHFLEIASFQYALAKRILEYHGFTVAPFPS